MKRSAIFFGIISMTLISCKKESTTTETFDTANGTVTVTTTTEHETEVDTARIHRQMDRAGERLDAAGARAKHDLQKAADETGKALDKAGNEIRAGAKNLGNKTEQAFQNAKSDAETKRETKVKVKKTTTVEKQP